MENPIKSQLNVNNIIRITVGLILVFAILDILNWTDYILYPYASAKKALGK